MVYIRIAILLDEKDHQRLHDMMAMAIVDENGRIKKRMFSGGYNQEWYRRVIMEGMNSLENEFEKEKQRIADEG